MAAFGMPGSDGVNSSSFMRDRVHGFEEEMQRVLNGMDEVEKSIASINLARRSWLESVGGADEIDAQTYLKRLDSFRILANIEQTHVDADSVRLDEVYEKQQLSMLIAATKPYEDDENDEMRDKLLTKLALEGTKDMKESLEKSVDVRRKAAHDTGDMLRKTDVVLSEYEQRGKMREDEVKARIDAYIRRLDDSIKEGQKKFKSLTQDYLVLRHNCKVAKEMLQRSKNEAHKEREDLQKSLGSVNEQTKLHLERQEHACEEERKKLTASLRQTVIKKEREIDSLRADTQGKKDEKKNATKEYKKLIKDYEHKYSELQDKRRREIKQITETLSELRTRVYTTERDALEGTTRTRILGGAIPGAEGHAAFSGGGTLRQNQALLALHEQMQQGHSEIDENNNQQMSSYGMRNNNNNNNTKNNDNGYNGFNLNKVDLEAALQDMGLDLNTINNLNLDDVDMQGLSELDLGLMAAQGMGNSMNMGNVPPPPNYSHSNGRSSRNEGRINSSTRSEGNGSGSGDNWKYARETDALTRDERDLAMLTVRLKQLHSIAKNLS